MEHLDEILERLMNKPKDKQTTIFDQIEEKLKELLSKKSVNKEFAVDNLLRALHMAEGKGDVNNF